MKKKVLFFCKQGILFDEKAGTPFIDFERVVQHCAVHSILENDFSTVVQGGLLLNTPFTVETPRSCLKKATDLEQEKLLKAIHLVSWDRQAKYCMTCGGALSVIEKGIEKKCAVCHQLFFPSLYPAVMVLVSHGQELLLGRSPHFAPGVYSALAGFVSVGETAEQAAIREVQEEVGLAIENVQYVGTQTWPFPASFMIAFTAKAADKKIKIDHTELEDAAWFSRDNLPELPAKPSIARLLIDTVLSQQ